MTARRDLILAVLRARRRASTEAFAERAREIESALDELALSGYLAVKPSSLELEAPAQLRGCLRVAHQAICGGHGELALEKLDVALHLVRLLEDYLRELTRLGTQVPLTWKEFVESQYQKNLLADSTASAMQEERDRK
jgi:hypothetical protein